MGLVLGPSLKIIYIGDIKNLPFIMYYRSALFLFTLKVHCLQTFEQIGTLGHQSVGVCEVSYTYLLGCLKY